MVDFRKAGLKARFPVISLIFVQQVCLQISLLDTLEDAGTLNGPLESVSIAPWGVIQQFRQDTGTSSGRRQDLILLSMAISSAIGVGMDLSMPISPKDLARV